jgi:hypothetical protein
MRSLRSRINQLEQQTGIKGAQIRFIVERAGQGEWALDLDRCVEILSECGVEPRGPISMLNFLRVPDGLGPAQLERHIREHAAEICPAARKPADQTRFARNCK